MPSPVQPSHSPSSAEGEKHARKQLDREIRDMVSAITDRVTDFHKPGSTNHMENDGEHGVHMDISDFSTEHEQHHRSHYQKEEKHGKKGKKIEKKASKSRHLSSSSSEDSD